MLSIVVPSRPRYASSTYYPFVAASSARMPLCHQGTRASSASATDDWAVIEDLADKHLLATLHGVRTGRSAAQSRMPRPRIKVARHWDYLNKHTCVVHV